RAPPTQSPQLSITAVPPQTPLQSRTHAVIPVVPPTQSPQLSITAVPPATPAQSISRPTHSQSAVHVSLPVEGSPSSHGVPGVFGPFGVPSQSNSAGVPTHSQLLFQVSLMVLPLPSLQGVPGKALPPQSSLQSATHAVFPVLPPTQSPQL